MRRGDHARSSLDGKCCKSRNGVDGCLKERRIRFDPNALVSHCGGGGDGRSRAHEWVEHDALAERKARPHDLSHKRLRFERRVWSDSSLISSSGSGCNNIGERCIRGKPPKSAGFPFSKIVLDPSFAGLAKDSPGFPTRSRHDGDVGELIMRILGPISPPQGLHQPNDLTALFESRIEKRNINEVGQQRTTCNEKMAARYESMRRFPGEFRKKCLHQCPICGSENREARNRISLTSIERGRNPPDSAAPAAQLSLFFRSVLL